MVAARCKPMFEEEARKRQVAAGGDRKSVRANLPEAIPDTGRARDQAAEAVNVSPRSVEYASKVVAQGIPELVQSVESGSLSVSPSANLREADTGKGEAGYTDRH